MRTGLGDSGVWIDIELVPGRHKAETRDKDKKALTVAESLVRADFIWLLIEYAYLC